MEPTARISRTGAGPTGRVGAALLGATGAAGVATEPGQELPQRGRSHRSGSRRGSDAGGSGGSSAVGSTAAGATGGAVTAAALALGLGLDHRHFNRTGSEPRDAPGPTGLGSRSGWACGSRNRGRSGYDGRRSDRLGSCGLFGHGGSSRSSSSSSARRPVLGRPHQSCESASPWRVPGSLRERWSGLPPWRAHRLSRLQVGDHPVTLFFRDAGQRRALDVESDPRHMPGSDPCCQC